MSIKIMSQVWETGPSDRSELLVMLALADFSNDTGECWPSMKSIAAKARMTERGAQKILARLEAAGRVSITKGGGRHGCNIYRIEAKNPERECRNPEQHSPNTSAETTNTVHPEQRSPRTGAQKPRTGVQETPNGRSPEPSGTVKNRHSSSSTREEVPDENPFASQVGDAPPDDDKLYDEVLAAVGLTGGMMPAHWMPPAAVIHVGRWRSQLGLTHAEIIATAKESRKRHDTPLNGPKGLDTAMERTAGAKVAPLRPRASQHGKPDDKAKRMALYDSIIGKAEAGQ